MESMKSLRMNTTVGRSPPASTRMTPSTFLPTCFAQFSAVARSDDPVRADMPMKASDLYSAHKIEAEQIAEVRSATLGRQLEYAMKESNNMLFEMFGREAALAAGTSPDFTGSTQATVATLAEQGIGTQQLTFVDNSGLSPRSRATLYTTVELFELMLTDDQYRPLLHTLTVAGYDGTMQNRMTEAPYSGTVRTKTGTLEVASSNAGLTVTTEGRTLWFAINTTGGEGDYEQTRAEQDHLTKVLTACECAPE